MDPTKKINIAQWIREETFNQIKAIKEIFQIPMKMYSF